MLDRDDINHSAACMENLVGWCPPPVLISQGEGCAAATVGYVSASTCEEAAGGSSAGYDGRMAGSHLSVDHLHAAPEVGGGSSSLKQASREDPPFEREPSFCPTSTCKATSLILSPRSERSSGGRRGPRLGSAAARGAASVPAIPPLVLAPPALSSYPARPPPTRVADPPVPPKPRGKGGMDVAGGPLDHQDSEAASTSPEKSPTYTVPPLPGLPYRPVPPYRVLRALLCQQKAAEAAASSPNATIQQMGTEANSLQSSPRKGPQHSAGHHDHRQGDW
jgi:hypothetical protein